MTQPDDWTVGKLLQWTADYLGKHNSDSPRLDAEVLLSQALGCERIQLYTAYHEVPDESQRTKFRQWVLQRAEGAPVAYLVGKREFYSLRFDVTPAVLIPRPETELVVLEALEWLKRRAGTESSDEEHAPAEVADVGTGSGAIAASVAHQCPSCRVTAIDIQPDALEVARQNVERLELADRVRLLQGNVLESVPAETSFDLVLSNPPYVTEAEWEELPIGVRDYEPRTALVGGSDGCQVIRELIPQAAERLRPGGRLIIEISPQIRPAVQACFDQEPKFGEPAWIKDLSGRIRVVLADVLG